jgi:3-hydroxyisobutyrate dehydrogenase-like beta-hydroxyacid dehydrogenase
MTDVGFIGLGTMGEAMALRLLDAGHRVVAWNRSPGAVERLVAAGAVAADAPADALRTGVALSMLADDTAVDAVFSDRTLAEARGAAHVNMSTVSTDSARRLQARHAAHGVGYAAAPVLGRPHLAAAGQLNIVAAGAGDALDRAAPFLAVLGKRVWQLGPDAAHANLVKIGVNFNLIHTMQALAESIDLLERGGVDGRVFVDVLTDAAYTGTAYQGYGPLIAGREYLPAAFAVHLGLKDLSLTEAAAAESGAVLPTAGVLREIFEETLRDPDLAARDWSAMAEITRRRGAPAPARPGIAD